MREQQAALEALGASAVAVGFSPAEPLATLADHLHWPWPFLSDPERLVYTRLGLPRARRRDVYSRANLERYREAVERGEAPPKPEEDLLQLGGDAVVRHGSVVHLVRSTTPDDRPSTATLLAAVADAAQVPGGPSMGTTAEPCR